MLYPWVAMRLLILLWLGIALESQQSIEGSGFRPAAACSSFGPESSAARQECFLANDSWLGDAGLARAKRDVAQFMARPKRLVNLRNSGRANEGVIYLHAAVLGDHIGGLLIMDKILNAIHFSGLVDHVSMVVVVAMGNITHVHDLTSQYRKVYLITHLSHLVGFNEFPTLALLQQHARYLHPDAKILYLHTKGVSKFGDYVRAFNRELMIQYCIHMFDQSIRALSSGYDTSGHFLLDSPYPHYTGNFFWIRAGAAASNANVTNLVWRWRFGAEMWPLHGVQKCKIFSPKFDVDDFNKWVNTPTSVMFVKRLSVETIGPPRC